MAATLPLYHHCPRHGKMRILQEKGERPTIIPIAEMTEEQKPKVNDSCGLLLMVMFIIAVFFFYLM
ncbi:unnamed protein product [Caenorhabditis brenneri]